MSLSDHEWEELRTQNEELKSQVVVLRQALREIERHHVALNQRAGRPEERSRTLALVRGALHHKALS